MLLKLHALNALMAGIKINTINQFVRMTVLLDRI